MGLLFVDWALLVRRSATEPDECEDRLGRSVDRWHASGMLLMGFEIFSSTQVQALSFILSSSLREMEKT